MPSSTINVAAKPATTTKNVGALTHEELSVYAETDTEMDMPEPITDVAADGINVYDVSISHLNAPRPAPASLVPQGSHGDPFPS